MNLAGDKIGDWTPQQLNEYIRANITDQRNNESVQALSRKVDAPVPPPVEDKQGLIWDIRSRSWTSARQGFYRPTEVGAVEWVVYNFVPAGSFATTNVDLRTGFTGGAGTTVPQGARALVARAVLFNYNAVGCQYDIVTPAGNAVISLRTATAGGVTVESCVIVPLGFAPDGTRTYISHAFTLAGTAVANLAMIAFGWLF